MKGFCWPKNFKNFQLPPVTLQIARGKQLASQNLKKHIQLGFTFGLVKINYGKTSEILLSFSCIFQKLAQMYEQNMTNSRSSVFTYEGISLQASNNQGLAESLPYSFMSCSYILPCRLGVHSPGLQTLYTPCISIAGTPLTTYLPFAIGQMISNYL